MTDKEFNLTNIEADELLDRAQSFKKQGYRLVQIQASNVDGGQEITYSFDLNLEMQHLRVTLPTGAPIMSITGPYFAAFVYENEIKDLFDVNVKHMALDFGGNFFITAEEHPWQPEKEE